MDSIVFFRINENLGDCQECGKHGMICKENIVEINFSGLGVIDKVAVSVVDTVEQEAGEVHGNEIEVHALYTEISEGLLFDFVVCVNLTVKGN